MGNALPSSITVFMGNVDKDNISAEQLLNKIHDLCVDDFETLRSLFAAADGDGNGTLSEAELCAVLAEYGFPVEGELRADLWSILDKDGDGKVSYKEFLKVLQERDYTHGAAGDKSVVPDFLTVEEAVSRVRLVLRDQLDSVKASFKKLDKDNSGGLSLDELATSLREMGLTISDELVKRIYTVMDKDDDGSVRFNEFFKTMEGGDLSSGQAQAGEAKAEDRLDRVLASKVKAKLTSAKVSADDVFQRLHDKMSGGSAAVMRAFDRVDTDKSNSLTYPEVERVLGDLGFQLDDELKEHVFKVLDKDLDGSVRKNEFVRVLCHRDYSEGTPSNKMILYPQLLNSELISRIRNGIDMNPLTSLREAFKKADTDNSGTVTEEELIEILRDLGFTVEEAVNRRLFRVFDVNGDGEMRYSEFIKVIGASRP